MIDHLRGRIAGGGKDFVVVECAGIGFRVHVSAATRKELPPEGESCLVRTHLHFREGGGDLYGFSSEAERELFLAIVGVSGVGPKSAISVLSVMGVSGVLAACAREDAVAFTRVPGIGKKLAQRIALELPDRLKKVAVEFASMGLGEGEAPPSAPESEAVQALVSLGFPRAEAQAAVSAVRRESGSEGTAEILIRESLKRLSARAGLK
ncbi:MAG: Holliday junction branch migration protein RuvA [Deltaproteobacteria bacterium]|nr:Holliday junction branch migration protein RuvA [Deltaproteobacteria bacterium]